MKNFAARLRRKLTLLRNPNAIKTFELPDGTTLTCYLGSTMGRLLTVDGDIDPFERAFVKATVKPGDVFIDAGANVGLYSVTAKRAGAEVHAFEPAENYYSMLRLNMLSCDGPGSYWLNNALSDANGEVTFMESAPSGINIIGFSTGHELRKCHTDFDPIAASTIYAITIDDYCLHDKWEGVNPSFIKIDVEGAELLVLQGARQTILRYRPVILCEFVDAALAAFGTSGAELHDYIGRMGYRLHEITEGGALVPHQRRERYDYMNLAALPMEMKN